MFIVGPIVCRWKESYPRCPSILGIFYEQSVAIRHLILSIHSAHHAFVFSNIMNHTIVIIGPT